MKINHTLKAMIAVLSVSWCFGYGQGAEPKNPSVSSLMANDNYPVDYYTGMPNISLPIYTMPTRSDKININIGLSYNASSISDFEENTGNCGRGWHLSGLGSISRRVVGDHDERTIRQGTYFGILQQDIFQFNFLNFSGKFVLEKQGTSIVARLVESKGEIAHIEVIYEAESYDIKNFILYDKAGYKYIFGYNEALFYQVSDFFYKVMIPDYVPGPFDPVVTEKIKTAFHLQEIYSSNNVLLASYFYTRYNTSDGNSSIHTLSRIEIPDYGSIQYYDSNNSAFFNEKNRYTNIEIKNSNSELIRRFDFQYSADNSNKLIKIEEHAFEEAGETGEIVETDEIRVHELQYVITLSNNGVDKWGYPSHTEQWCRNDGTVDPNIITRNVLEKIIYPEGGVVYYKFEPNTFSYIGERPLEYGYAASGIRSFFYELSSLQFPSVIAHFSPGFNFHNYVLSDDLGIQGYMSMPNSPSFTFTIPADGPQSLLFKINATSYTQPPVQPDGVPHQVYPGFTLKKGSSTVATFSTNFGEDYGNDENFCNGKGVPLGEGTYTMTLNAPLDSGATGSFSTQSKTRVPINELKEYWQGGGIRVKSISYFTELPDDVRTAVPARKIDFNYNLFDQPNRSSGSLVRVGKPYTSNIAARFGYENNLNPVVYKNVSVSDSQSGGKTQYVYYSPLDTEISDVASGNDIRYGKLLKNKVYNTTGNLLQEITYDYDFDKIEFAGNIADSTAIGYLGWVPLKMKNIKNYVGQDFVETSETFTYYTNRDIKTHTKYFVTGGDNLETRYTYNTLNSPLFFNRSEIETVESYRNGELISKSKTNYANSWTNNVSYLPQSTQIAKGSNTLETAMKFNKYDAYGNLLESEAENGIKTSYIWGYNNTQIIAKIEGIGYDDIPAAKRIMAQTATTNYSENQVLSALTSLRNDAALSAAIMTSYTYIPLVGVSTITDARGRTLHYKYDPFNRLIRVEDNEGNILNETKYHTKSQN